MHTVQWLQVTFGYLVLEMNQETCPNDTILYIVG